MSIKRRIFISAPIDKNLTPDELNFKKHLISKVENAGYVVESFFEYGESADLTWSFEKVEKVINKCVGAIIMAFPRWAAIKNDHQVFLTTEYTHFEGALIHAARIPCLSLASNSVEKRGTIDQGAGVFIHNIPDEGLTEWMNTDKFKNAYASWMSKVDNRYDLFLGYCSKSESIAFKIQLFLTNKMKLKVKNWALDFVGGTSILSEIEKADHECTGGIFLFTRDDQIESDTPIAAPRDNVIFEAGYFIKSKGKERVIIVREKDAKMPADLGGDIYLHLEDKNSTSAIETRLRDFVENRL